MKNKYRLASFPREQMSVNLSCRSSDSPRSNRLPTLNGSGNRLNGTILWSLQQRDCTGIAPVSLLILGLEKGLMRNKTLQR